MKTNHVQSATGLPPVSTLSAPMHARLISKTETEFRTRDNTKDNATAKLTTRNKWPRIIVTKHGKRFVVLLLMKLIERNSEFKIQYLWVLTCLRYGDEDFWVGFSSEKKSERIWRIVKTHNLSLQIDSLFKNDDTFVTFVNNRFYSAPCGLITFDGNLIPLLALKFPLIFGS